MENEIIFIDEETYQQVKKEKCKSDDYFSEDDLENICKKLTTF